MSNSLKNRFFLTLLLGVLTFVSFCILYKLTLYTESWFYKAIFYSIFWALGFFVSRTLATKKHKITYNIFAYIIIVVVLEVIISFFALLTTLLVTKVIFHLQNWNYIFSNTCFPFIESLFVSNLFMFKD